MVERQGVGAEIADPRDLIEADAFGSGLAVNHHAVADVELPGLGLQHDRGDVEDLGAQRLPRLGDGLAADPGGAGRPGAAAIGRVLGIAGDHPHPVDGNPHRGRRDLGGDGLHALALFGGAGGDEHVAAGVETHGRPVLGRDAGPADAVEHRRRVGDLDEAGKPDAAPDARPPSAGRAPRRANRNPSSPGFSSGSPGGRGSRSSSPGGISADRRRPDAR